jgi:hypothetical protein
MTHEELVELLETVYKDHTIDFIARALVEVLNEAADGSGVRALLNSIHRYRTDI